MIMQRIEPDDDGCPLTSETPTPAAAKVVASTKSPGTVYRGVPQDSRSRFLRMDGCQSGDRRDSGQVYRSARRNQREASMSELFLG